MTTKKDKMIAEQLRKVASDIVEITFRDSKEFRHDVSFYDTLEIAADLNILAYLAENHGWLYAAAVLTNERLYKRIRNRNDIVRAFLVIPFEDLTAEDFIYGYTSD